MSTFRQNPTIQRVLASIVILVCALCAPTWPARATPPTIDRPQATWTADGLQASCDLPVPASAPTAPAGLHRGLDRLYRLAMIGPAVLAVTRTYVRDVKAVLFPADPASH